jgi:hypothetical protein
VPYTTLTVSVPEGTEAELLRFAATLATGPAGGEVSEPAEAPDDDASNGNGRRRWGFGRRSIQDAYLGGVSEVWRPFLEYLADRPDEWVEWSDLCRHINRTPRQASGVLGAAERRCHGRPPYEKKSEGETHYFRMPAHAATVIQELREED